MLHSLFFSAQLRFAGHHELGDHFLSFETLARVQMYAIGSFCASHSAWHVSS